MSHEVETMAYAGEVPWHKLGTRVSADLTPRQMMVKAGCDWEVNKVPTYAAMDGVDLIPTGSSALIRSSDNSVLAPNVGENWEPVQNVEAFDFFTEYCLAGDMEMHTAGSLADGKNVWALAKVNESFDVLGNDQVDSYLLFSNPHQYGKSLNVRFTPIRVVCNNTLTMSLSHKSKNEPPTRSSRSTKRLHSSSRRSESPKRTWFSSSTTCSQSRTRTLRSRPTLICLALRSEPMMSWRLSLVRTLQWVHTGTLSTQSPT